MFDDLSKLPPGRSLAEAHKARMASKPDALTCAWWKSQIDEVLAAYRGLCHALNLAVANMQDFFARVERLEKKVEELQAENQMLMAKAGELQSELTLSQAELSGAKKRIENMAEWAKKLKHGPKLDEGTNTN